MVKKRAKPLAKKPKNKALSVKEYAGVLLDIKNKIKEAQICSVIAANRELINLYWIVGKIIHEQQEFNGWGAKLVEELASDLQAEFPGIEGFSRSNLFRMRAFYLEYSNSLPPVRQFSDISDFSILSSIPWGHNIVLLEKIKSKKERLWYAHKVLESGWSRNILVMQIESDLYERQGKAVTNFSRTLALPDSDLAQQSLKDPYLLDFLTLRDEYVERDVEQGLIDHIQHFLLELGQGFAFVGRQVHLEIDDQDYYIDLLFYHIKLHCYVVIELKTGAFKPKDAGQIGFYLAAVDDKLKQPSDKPTIGLILCKSKRKLTVEYTLRSTTNPIAVSSYETKLIESLPKNLKSSLPSIAEIEAGLEKREILSEKKSNVKIKSTRKKKS